ncbi:hypothetical protein [Arthrobacter sp. NPDC057259]|uniref:hypothetical protein n=1 Tax=Arthrobacter sp. NPDC057259 TaxID=3346073 RepID=UPI003630FC75
MTSVSGQKPGTRAEIELPSNMEIGQERDPMRRSILVAMQRILSGHPKHVPLGANSVTHLAKEANVGRHHLYQRHPDLRHRFEYLRDRSDQPTEAETELGTALDRAKSELSRLRDLQSKTRQEAADWKALTELLARAINTLQDELHQEQIKAERLARRLQKLDDQLGSSAQVVLLHRRSTRSAE